MKKIIIIVSSILFTTVFANSLKTDNFPKELLFHGKPLDPLCFFEPEITNNTIQLDHCGLDSSTIKLGANEDMLKAGYYGFDWQKKESMPGGLHGASYYKAFSAGNKYYWFYTINNGGGSGDFTDLYLVKRMNETALQIKSYAGGDRCNGGVSNVTSTNAKITYSIKLTAFDLLQIANSNPKKLKPYDNLAACAICCFAEAHYAATTTSATLEYIDLGSAKSTAELPEQGDYQACFNDLLIEQIKIKKTKITLDQLKQLIDKFNNKC